MKNKIIFLLLFFFSSAVNSREIIGNWVVDVDATVKYNSPNFGMTALRVALLECVTPYTVTVVSDSSINDIVRAHSCSHNGKAANIEGYESSYKYKILYDSGSQTVILNSNDEGVEYIDVINWIDNDTFWIDLPEEDFNLRRTRYFYRR